LSPAIPSNWDCGSPVSFATASGKHHDFGWLADISSQAVQRGKELGILP
jgi:hypothetical protein